MEARSKPCTRNTAFSLISICLSCDAIFQFLTDAQFTSHSMCLQFSGSPRPQPPISFSCAVSPSLSCARPGWGGDGGGQWTDSLIDEQRRLGQKLYVCLRDSPATRLGPGLSFCRASKSRTCRSRTKYLTPAERIYGRMNLCVLLLLIISVFFSLPFPCAQSPIRRLDLLLIVIVHFVLDGGQCVCEMEWWLLTGAFFCIQGEFIF